MHRFLRIFWLVLIFVSMLALGFSDNLRGPLFGELLKEFNLSDSQGAWFFSLSSIFGFLLSVFSTRLLFRHSIFRVHVLALACMSLGSFGIGLSQSYMGLLFSACCYGAALGLTGVTQNSSIGILVSPTRVSQAMSGLHAMYGFSSFVAPLLVSKYLGVDFSWRTFFIGAGAFAAFVMIVALVAPYPAIAIRKDGEEKVDLSLRGLDARAYFLSFAVATYVIAEVLVGTRLSLYATREFGIPSASGSVYVMGFFLGLLSGRLYGMFFRIPGTLIQRIYASLFFSGVCIVFGLLLNPWGFVAVGAAMSMLYPAFIAYASAEYGLRISAVMGLVIAVQSILTVLMHQVVGWISDLLGIGFAMYLTFLFLGLSTYLFHRARTVTKASPNMSNNS